MKKLNKHRCKMQHSQNENQFISLNSLSIAFAFDIQSHKFMITKVYSAHATYDHRSHIF